MKNPRTTTQVIVAADKNRLTDKSTREHKISQKNNFQHPFNLAYFNRSSKCIFIANLACYVCYFLFYCMKSTKICIFEYLPRSSKCTRKSNAFHIVANLIIVLHELSLLFWHLINASAITWTKTSFCVNWQLFCQVVDFKAETG